MHSEHQNQSGVRFAVAKEEGAVLLLGLNVSSASAGRTSSREMERLLYTVATLDVSTTGDGVAWTEPLTSSPLSNRALRPSEDSPDPSTRIK